MSADQYSSACADNSTAGSRGRAPWQMFPQAVMWPHDMGKVQLSLVGCCVLQEEQRAERQAAKAAAQHLSVREKTTFASRQQALFSDDTIRTAFHETLQASKKVRQRQPGA